MHELKVKEGQEGERLDKFLVQQLNNQYTRTHIQQWIEQGHILINGSETRANHKVRNEEIIQISIPESVPSEILAEEIPLNIVYEDEDVIVVYKPRGLVVHPSVGHTQGTLVNGLLYHCKDLSGINGEKRPGIVHRIDKDTSGLLMVAKNDQAHLSLADQLKAHEVKRKYMAFVYGKIPHDYGTIDAPIGRDSTHRKKFVVTSKNSKRAVTHFAVKERFENITFVELSLETGRTHQIRVHMKYIQHPIVGDPLYTGAKNPFAKNGQLLHAATLGFVHPTTQEFMEFEAPLPEDMREFVQHLRT